MAHYQLGFIAVALALLVAAKTALQAMDSKSLSTQVADGPTMTQIRERHAEMMAKAGAAKVDTVKEQARTTSRESRVVAESGAISETVLKDIGAHEEAPIANRAPAAVPATGHTIDHSLGGGAGIAETQSAR